MNKDCRTFDEKFSVALLESGSRALLLGGVACITYGSTRFSEDTDWWIDPTKGMDTWIKFIIRLALKCKEPCQWISLRDQSLIGKFPEDQKSAHFVKNLRAIVEEDAVVRIRGDTGLADIFFMPHRLHDFEMAWKRSKPLDGCLRKLCIPDLIETKRDTGRKVDEEDIRFLSMVQKGSL